MPVATRRSRSIARVLAGPLLIVVSVIVVLHAFVFSGRVVIGDLTTFFGPSYCFLGKSLASGHVPAWNPYTMAGTPFAADPQSGWMYAPPMLLFSALSCARALRWIVVVQPLLAGLGLYAFLRQERVSRPAATVGGLVLALGISDAALVSSLPFSGAIAWTAVLLAAAARYTTRPTWGGRILWLVITAFAWGQIAAAHFSVGLLIGTGALVGYGVAKSVHEVRTKAWSVRDVAVLALLLILALPLVNLAFLLPRLAYLPETSIGLGYARLQALAVQLTGQQALRVQRLAVGTRWPLKFSTLPGTHLGAIPLALAFGGLWGRRHRHLFWGFAIVGLLSYLASLKAVADRVPSGLRTFRLFDFYLHSPQWLGYGVLVAMAVLAALGLDAWLEPRPWRERILVVAPGILVWWLLPPLFGAGAKYLWLLAAGAVVGGVLLVAVPRRPRLVPVVVAVAALELVVAGLFSYRPGPFEPIPRLLEGLVNAGVDTGALFTKGPIAETLSHRPGGRSLTFRIAGWNRLQADPLSSAFGVEEVQGYNPVQLLRYWSFVRKTNSAPLEYNLSIFSQPPPPVVLNLLQVEFLTSRYHVLAGRTVGPIAEQGARRVYVLSGAQPRASLVEDWTVVGGADEALGAVTASGFDPATEAILEVSPGLPTGFSPTPGATASATYRQRGTQAAEVAVTARVPSLVLIRTPFERGWHARVDGRATTILRADYLIQAVPIASGTHVIELSYDDPSIGYGMAGSAVSVGLLLVGAAILRRRSTGAATRRPPPGPGPTDGSGPADGEGGGDAGQPEPEAVTDDGRAHESGDADSRGHGDQLERTQPSSQEQQRPSQPDDHEQE
jgi:hypothetical protein